MIRTVDRIRGYNYNNVPIGQTSWDIRTEHGQLQADINEMKAMGINAVRLYYDAARSVADWSAVLDAFYAAGIDVAMFCYLSQSTDYSKPAGQGNRTTMVNRVTTMVTALKHHPAIIMWGVGNENNLVPGPSSIRDIYGMLNDCIVAAKTMDTTRPYLTANGEVHDIIKYGQYVPQIDIWGINIYRGQGIGALREQIQKIHRTTGKSVVITEVGYNAKNSAPPATQLQFQARVVLRIIRQIEALHPLSVGYFMFQAVDGWNKAGNPSQHDDDPAEHWGHMEAVEPGHTGPRPKKPVFDAVKDFYTSYTYGAAPFSDIQIFSVDTMKDSRDRHTLTRESIDVHVDAAAWLRPTHIAIDCFMDWPDQFCMWVDSIRRYNAKIIFRLKWWGWEYERMSPTVFIDSTLTFIESNAAYFKDGDIFDVCAEVEEGSYWYNFGDGNARYTAQMKLEYNQMIIDMFEGCTALFNRLGLDVIANHCSHTPGSFLNNLIRADVAEMHEWITCDSYPEGNSINPATCAVARVNELEALSAKYPTKKIFITEMGYSLTSGISAYNQAAVLAAVLAAIAELPYIYGVSYWVGAGYDGTTNIISYNNGAWIPKPAARIVASHFENRGHLGRVQTM